MFLRSLAVPQNGTEAATEGPDGSRDSPPRPAGGAGSEVGVFSEIGSDFD